MNQGLPPESDTWDRSLQELGGSLLQSYRWGRFQQSLGRQQVYDQGEGWQWLASVRVSRGLRYGMCSYGPAAATQQAMESALKSLATAGNALGWDFVRVEPQAQAAPDGLSRMGAIKIGEADPQHTQIINLILSETELRGRLASGHRNLINGTERRGIGIKEMTTAAGVDLMYPMLQDTARRSRVTFYPKDYYQLLIRELADNSALYVAEIEGQPVAAALFYDWGSTRYYAHAGAHQELNRKAKASVSLVWQAILDAKAQGMTKFDLGGTAPSGDDAHALASLTKFKAAFGGDPVTYAGTWDIPLKRHKYRVYGVYRRLRGRH